MYLSYKPIWCGDCISLHKIVEIQFTEGFGLFLQSTSKDFSNAVTLEYFLKENEYFALDMVFIMLYMVQREDKAIPEILQIIFIPKK